MTYVIDASVAVKWFVDEILQDEALRLLDDPSELCAPDWLLMEVTHAIFKKWRDGEIRTTQAESVLPALRDTELRLLPSTDLIDRAFYVATAIRHPVYDCLYIACAEIYGGIVITTDSRFCRNVDGTRFAYLVQHLEHMSS